MILSVLERVIALSLLPPQGSYATLRILTELRMSLSFSEKEMEDWGISQDGSKTVWKKDEEAELPIGEKATDEIVKALHEHDEAGTLPLEAMSLYEKFITTE